MNTEKNEDTLVRNYKDSVFRMLFNEKKNLIELYNALFDADYDEDTPLEFETIEEVLFKTIKNDIAFTIEDRYIVLVEHQSTINENMAVRDLVYFSTIIQNMFSNKDFYRRKALILPNPFFIVLYNGTEELPDFETIRLSDQYRLEEENPALQLTVKVYNVNEGSATELLNKCKILWEYSRFVAIVRKYAEEGTMNNEVVQKILKECREEGILTEFLDKHGEEAVNMLFLEMTEEEARELSKEDGFSEGFDEGIQEGMRVTAQKMKQKGIDLAVIAECTGLSEQEIETL